MLAAVIDQTHRGLRLVVGLLFAVLLAAVLFQIGTRLMSPKPPVWTEELSRFCLILIAAFGAGLALRSGELVGVDILTAGLSARARRAVDMFGHGVLITFCLALIPPGLDFVDIGLIQTSPALEWTMVWMHLAVIVAPLTLALASLERMLALIAGRTA